LSNKTSIAIVTCALLALPHVTAVYSPAAAQTITVGATGSTSDAPIYIADKKGYFQAEACKSQ
jgi:ABC-type nitrate/sulfonate/bicarbonate transport system substrate-binding protein